MFAPELYGVSATIGASQASTPITNNTNLIFYGTSATGTVGDPILISGWDDAVEKLGCTSGDGHNLTDACIAAFKVCNLKQIYVVPVSNSTSPANTAYTDALLNISDLWMKYGIVANLLCIPRMQEATVISALVTAAKKQDGKWDGCIIYDAIQDSDQLTAAGRPILTELTSAKVKTSSDKICICHWGYAKLKSGDIISGAALRAGRLALADMQNPGSLPSRCSGNLDIDIESTGLVFVESDEEVYYPINAKKADLDSLSADGIGSFLNIGGGQYVTWGDHSAAYTNGTITDEAGRFDNYMRMMYHITNRFQAKYRNIIDDKLTLKVRNDILSEENDYLNLLVSQEALVGSPRCVFSEAENSTETAQKGEFYFEDVITVTPPCKYLSLKVIFSSEGYIVYQEA